VHISSLVINNLRIVEKLQIEPAPGINFIVGDNGAGKTSILEAIYLAGRGRTFRHKDAGPMIGQGADSVTVVVGIDDENSERRSTLGIRREKSQFICRLDGKDVKKRSILAETLPVQWVGSQPQLFLSMGPDVRRRFLDMGMFHVEHSYLSSMLEFQRILRQRNAALRKGNAEEVRIWNKPLSVAAESLNKRREYYVDLLMTRVVDEIGPWNPGYTLSYRYRPGWKGDSDLFQQLEESTESDLRLGYTTRGPQRAELELLADGATAEKKLSRGQQKILVLALNLALSDLISERKGSAPILLVDDLAAELDPMNRSLLVAEFEKRQVQVFLTKIEDDSLRANVTNPRTFHVEQGAIR